LCDDAMPALDLLKDYGWSHILLTNHIPELEPILDYLGLNQRFKEVFNSAWTGYEKPHPEAFRQILNRFDAETKVVWMIGDSFKADIRGAEAAGIRSILVRNVHPEARTSAANLMEAARILLDEHLRCEANV